MHTAASAVLVSALYSTSVTDTISIAETIKQGGAILILILVCMALVYAYREERRKNDKLHAQILDNSKAMLTSLNSVATALDGFKDMLIVMSNRESSSHIHSPRTSGR